MNKICSLSQSKNLVSAYRLLADALVKIFAGNEISKGGKDIMEKAFLELANLVAHSNNPITALAWTLFMGIFVLLPSVNGITLRSHFAQVLTQHIVTFSLWLLFNFTFVTFLGLVFPSSFFGTYFNFRSHPLLHIAALGLTALWIWLYTLRIQHKASKENASEVVRDITCKDWMTATRLALWLTISLMPTFKGF